MTMKQTTLLSMLTLAVGLTACQTPPHAAAKLEARQRWDQVRGRVKLQLAQQEYESKLFEQAIRNASEAVALEPTQVEAYVLLAQANLELGKPATAQQAIQTAEHMGLSNPDLIYTQGVILEQRNQLDAALAKYAEARELDPTQVDYLVAHVECLVELNRPEIGLNLLNANKDRFDEDGTVAMLSARVAELLGDTQAAVKSYRDAMVTLGDSSTVTQELGLLLVRLKRYDEAAAVLEPLADRVSAAELSGAVRRALATCRLAGRDPIGAGEILRQYGREHPEDVRAQLLIAEAAIGADDTLTALRAVDTAYQREPHNPQVQLMRAVVQWKRRNFSQAAGSLFDLLSEDPENVEAHCLLAEVLRARENFDAAETHFQRALEIDPQCLWASEGLKSLSKESRPAAILPATKLTSATGPLLSPDAEQ
jgi:Tfp pilus assembly protein PilF